MSRFAEVIVIARDAEEVMAPLTIPDNSRSWPNRFTRIDEGFFEDGEGGADSCFTWVIQFQRATWAGLIPDLESLEWPDPFSVQVLIRDEEDDCFGLWMLYDGKLVEVALPRTERFPFKSSVTGVLKRQDAAADR
ncbi:hypothetical protein ACFVFS_20875 [Kitasatospora sp. NPDC057692]|uniref:hypothetical protein n=1 Tax=Kitasatospora sp. NPDC057692 TaxID=3346215 RepID=UPI00369C0B02